MKRTIGNVGLRPTEEIEPHEWAKLARARRTTDPRKLQNLLPAWLRSHINRGAMPKPFVPDFRVVVPNLATRQTDPRAGYKFPYDLREKSTLDYVREFCEANQLLSPNAHVPAPAYEPRHKPAREFERFAARLAAARSADQAAAFIGTTLESEGERLVVSPDIQPAPAVRSQARIPSPKMVLAGYKANLTRLDRAIERAPAGDDIGSLLKRRSSIAQKIESFGFVG